MLPGFVLALFQRTRNDTRTRLQALVLAPLGGVIFALYLWQLNGDPLSFSHNQAAWNRFQQGFFELVAQLASDPGHVMMDWNFIWLNAGVALLATIGAVWFVLSKRPDYALLLFLPIAASLATGTVLSLARFVVALFPFLIFLGMITERPWAERTALTACAVGLGMATWLYGSLVTAFLA